MIIGVMFDYNDDYRAIVNDFENKVVSKSNVNGVKIDISELECALTACNTKVEKKVFRARLSLNCQSCALSTCSSRS